MFKKNFVMKSESIILAKQMTQNNFHINSVSIAMTMCCCMCCMP